jgi:large subunit ribosomal protein L2
MFLQKVKPTTASRRQLIKLNNKSLNLSKKPLLKTHLAGKKNSSGRNNSGKITVFHKGGGTKKKYRKINFERNYNSTAIVCTIEHDPNRSCYISSVFDFIDKTFYYILTPQNLRIGDIVKSGLKIEPSLGSSLPISDIPIGTPIHNISPSFSSFGKISRSAGTFSIIKEKTEQYCLIELSSGEQRYISPKCFASIGEVSKELHLLTRLGKAGQSRWRNKRPTVRGVAMNPVDHPHGGGEGKKSGRSVTPWGKPNQRGKTTKSRNKLIFKKK